MFGAIAFPLALLFFQQETPVSVSPPTVWELLQSKYDTDQDSKISSEEHGRGLGAFSNLDADGDGFITQTDLEAPTGGASRRSQERENKMRNQRVAPPKVGELAPDFELRVLVHEEKAENSSKKASSQPRNVKAAKEKEEVKAKTILLSSFAGEKPVALIFGSYT
ncbi:MAG: hypothetical protein O3A50_02140 [Planctomycetota bacterium]|nr:hypothetical protein [Planctomycetota bacterium]